MVLTLTYYSEVAPKGHLTEEIFAPRRNLAASESVMYANPRYDGGRFTLSPQKRPPFLFS
jgi:hypothetical protein